MLRGGSGAKVGGELRVCASCTSLLVGGGEARLGVQVEGEKAWRGGEPEECPNRHSQKCSTGREEKGGKA